MSDQSIACWNCAVQTQEAVTCSNCEALLPPTGRETHFSLFGIEPGILVNETELKGRFLELSRRFHPDFFGEGEPREQAISLEWSSRLNNAYRDLGDLYRRVEYLLGLHGRSLEKGDGGWEPSSELLIEVFELNEQLEEARAAIVGGDEEVLATALNGLEGTKKSLLAREAQIEAAMLEQGHTWGELPGDETAQEETKVILDAWGEQLARLAYVRNLLRQIAAVERDSAC